MAKRFTAEEILALSANPNVKNVRSNRLTLTFEFRTELYNAWALNPGVRVLREMFENNGFDAKMIPNEYLHGISETFRRCGAPSSGKNRVKRNALKIDQENTNYLLDTGKIWVSDLSIQVLPDGTILNRKEFCDYYNIPYRTVTDWEAGKRKMPEYVLELMEFKADVEQLKTANT